MTDAMPSASRHPRASRRTGRFRTGYAVAATVLLLVEAAIALWVDDAVIRPHAGDSLAVMLVHCALRAGGLPVTTAILVALLIAGTIELSQLYHFVDAVGLGSYPVARAVLGTGFDPRDFLAYGVGAAIVLWGEALRRAFLPARRNG